jgi:hypothetical protein
MHKPTFKSKAIFVTGLGAHRAVRYFLDNQLADGGEVVNPITSCPLTQEDSWYSFLLEAQMTSKGMEPTTFLNQLHQKYYIKM